MTLLFDEAGNRLLADEVLIVPTIMLAESMTEERGAGISFTMSFIC